MSTPATPCMWDSWLDFMPKKKPAKPQHVLHQPSSKPSILDGTKAELTVYREKDQLRDILEIIDEIDPDLGGDNLRKFFKSWIRQIKRTEYDLAMTHHWLQAVHALKGFGCQEMDRWIRTQMELTEAQSRHMQRWASAQATEALQKKFNVLREDFRVLLELLKMEIVEDDYKRIMARFKALRSGAQEGDSENDWGD